MKLSGNKILITGAAEGIGKALTLKFLQHDNQVIAIGRNQDKLEALSATDKRIIPFRCDLSLPDELAALSAFINQHHKDTNILINNAGIQYNYNFSSEPDFLEKIDHEITVNLTAPIKLIAMLLPVLMQNENSAIVNVSSGLGLVPKMQAPVYCGTKGAIHIFSKSLRYQLDKVKVFEIIPPLVDTPMTKGRGTGKITPGQLAHEFMQSFKTDNYEVNIGKVKLLKLVNRISPSIADRIMKGGK